MVLHRIRRLQLLHRLHQIRQTTSKASLTHLDSEGQARMVDISDKPATRRVATAIATVDLGPSIYKELSATMDGTGSWKKGDVLTIAQVAGIQAAKQTSTLIPLCHPLHLSHVGVRAALQPPHNVHIEATATTTGGTGVEMEALTAASVAALTVYDMCKAAGKGIVISNVKLVDKSGGRSGHYSARDDTSSD